MTGFAQLQFASAVRWALLSPASVIAACVLAGIVLYARSGGDFAFAFQLHSPDGIPNGLAVILALAGLLFGPSLVFMLVWNAARR